MSFDEFQLRRVGVEVRGWQGIDKGWLCCGFNLMLWLLNEEKYDFRFNWEKLWNGFPRYQLKTIYSWPLTNESPPTAVASYVPKNDGRHTLQVTFLDLLKFWFSSISESSCPAKGAWRKNGEEIMLSFIVLYFWGSLYDFHFICMYGIYFLFYGSPTLIMSYAVVTQPYNAPLTDEGMSEWMLDGKVEGMKDESFSLHPYNSQLCRCWQA